MGAVFMLAFPELLLGSANASASLVDKNGNAALHLACSNVSVTLSDEPLCFAHALGFTSKLSEVNGNEHITPSCGILGGWI